MATAVIQQFAHHRIISFEIASGQDLSDVIDVREFKLFAIHMPSAFDGGSLTIEASHAEAGPFHELFDDNGNQLTVTVAVDRMIGLDNAGGALAACRYIRFRSSGNETATRELQLLMKE